MKMNSKSVLKCIGIAFCLLNSAVLSAESADILLNSRVENRSYSTQCAEVDNIDMPIYAKGVSAFRVTAKHPSYFPAPINIREPDFSYCTFGDQLIWGIGRRDGSAAEFNTVGDVDSHEFFAPDRPAAGQDMQAFNFPQAIGAGAVMNQFIRFTADEDSDANVEIKIGAVFQVNLSAIEGGSDPQQITLRCLTWDGTEWHSHGDRTFTRDQMNHAWKIPDLTWIDGTDANRIHLRVVTAEEGGKTSPGARGYYDYVELQRRTPTGETTLPSLVRNDFIEVVPVHIDFWWRHPESMTVEVVGGETETDVHYLRILKSAPGSSPPDFDEIFVLYEDGNARIIPLAPEGADISYGASIILGASADAKRPVAPIEKVVVDPQDFAMDLYYKDGTMLHLELWADRTQTVVDVTRQDNEKTDSSFARLRSMWVYDGKADVDRVRSEQGSFPFTNPSLELNGNWWQFVKTVPTYHNTYSPDFHVEILDSSLAYLVQEAEQALPGHSGRRLSNPAASASQALAVTSDGGEATFRINLDRPQVATQMRVHYADDATEISDSATYHRLHAYVDGNLLASTFMAGTRGTNDFEIAPGLFLGDLASGEHMLKLVVDPGTRGIQLDRLELISQPMLQRRVEPVLSIEAENLSGGDGYSQVSRDIASGEKTIQMNAKGGTAIFDVRVPVLLEEAYLTLSYRDNYGANAVQIFVDGEIAAKFPSLNSNGQTDFITSPELFIGRLTSGEHEIQITTSLGSGGVEFDEFSIFTR